MWLADGRMVYATASGQRAGAGGARRGRERELVSFEGSIEFVVSPHGEQIAYRVDDGTDLSGIDVIDVASATLAERDRVADARVPVEPGRAPAVGADGGGRALTPRHSAGSCWTVDPRSRSDRVRPEPHLPGGLRAVLRPVRAVDDPLVTGRRRVRLRRVDRRWHGSGCRTLLADDPRWSWRAVPWWRGLPRRRAVRP